MIDGKWSLVSKRAATAAINLCAVGFLLMTSGCGTGPAAIRAVSFDFEQLSQQLIAEHDTDKNGALSEEELVAVPPIADRLSRFDIDRNGEVSSEELRKNLRRIFDPSTAVVTTACLVTRNGRPLSDAEVRFIPLGVFKDALPVATGVTDADGAALVSAPRDALPDSAPKILGLMRPGLYMVEITHNQIDIPEKYNKKTVVGKEVSIETIMGGNIRVNLQI